MFHGSLRARSLARGVKRTPYPSDTRHAKFDFYELHPINCRVFIDKTRVVSLSFTWPLESGVVEKEDKVFISSSHTDYTRLATAKCRFPVYVWDSIARVGYSRGEFTVTQGENEFVLERVTPESIADDVIRTVNTKMAVDMALDHSCEEFEEKRRRVVKPVVEMKKFNGFSRPTVYKGVEYRSLTEARFAIALDCLNIPFSFETMSFKRPGGGRYTPDFFLPNQQLLVEIKPSRPLVDEEEKCEELSATGFRIVCMFGERISLLPFAYQQGRKRDYSHKEGMRGIAWHNGEKLAGEVAFVIGKNPKSTPSSLEMMGEVDVPHLDVICSSKDVRWNSPTIQSALKTAGDTISE